MGKSRTAKRAAGGTAGTVGLMLAIMLGFVVVLMAVATITPALTQP